MGAEPPSAQQLREKNDVKYIARHGQLTAYVLRLLGFNMDLCPVLDISYDDDADNALRGRCYGTDAQQVITNAGIFNANLRHYRIQSCGKHFPSCGLADTDPHHAIPHVHKSVQDMFESDLLPYTALMPELDAIMSCHAYFSAIDPDTPSLPGSLSHNLLTKLLRMQLGYEGVIMTDDLDMGAIVNTYGRGPDVELAIRAGNDMAMICHRIDTAGVALNHLKNLPHTILDDALLHIERMKKKSRKPIAFDAKLWREIDADIAKLRHHVVGEENEISSQNTPSNSPVEDY
jgi:beta-N-acetylhexosaminidase